MAGPRWILLDDSLELDHYVRARALPSATRRSRLEIWTDILIALPMSQGGRAVARPTRVQSAANVPHNRFWGHVRAMELRGLVTTAPLALTPLGQDFLRQATEVQRFLREFQLSPSPDIFQQG